ncbi:MAG: hypothetical protein RR562_11355, partial [Longicatena sp.]
NLVYGFGYTQVLQEQDGIHKTMDIFVPREDTIKIQYITLENTTEEEKEIDISYRIEPVLGVTQEINLQYILCKQEENAILLKNPYSIEFSNCTSFVTVVGQSDATHVQWNTDHYSVTLHSNLKAKGKETFAIILGCSENQGAYFRQIQEKYNEKDAILKELDETKIYWEKKVTNSMQTGDVYLDIMANGWLLYQTIVCRLYARSAFYQSGGALGYRDQLQDTLALIDSWPERTREQIVLHASKQFEKGDVLHWWHPHNNAGIRTYFSDDYLWLPYVLAEYVERTKDYSVLEVEMPYLEDKPMGNQREMYDVFSQIDKKDSVYIHAKLAIQYSLSRIHPTNGLLDIGDGDWNDGFSNIRGQSVWLTFFMMAILDKFTVLA